MSDSSSGRIVAALREWVAAAPAGVQLPSTRQLVAEFGASPVTVQKALRTLIGQGFIESRPGVGTFVRFEPLARTITGGRPPRSARHSIAFPARHQRSARRRTT
jgi:DNA-binding GntR family transcriptional regulator